MSKKIEIEWYVSPFEHARYTLFTSEKKMRKAGFEPCPSDSPAITHFYDDDRIVVLIKKDAKQDKDVEIALIVHEATHVWQKIQERMGEQYPSDEFEAYSIQKIFLGLFYLYQNS